MSVLTIASYFPFRRIKIYRDALHISIFNNSFNENWFSDTIRSPLWVAILTVEREIPGVCAKCVMVNPNSDEPQ